MLLKTMLNVLIIQRLWKVHDSGGTKGMGRRGKLQKIDSSSKSRGGGKCPLHSCYPRTAKSYLTFKWKVCVYLFRFIIFSFWNKHIWMTILLLSFSCLQYPNLVYHLEPFSQLHSTYICLLKLWIFLLNNIILELSKLFRFQPRDHQLCS